MHQRIRFLIMGLAWLVTAVTQAGQQARFADWRADCDAVGACAVAAKANGVQVRFTRPGPGEPMALLITAPGIITDGDLTLEVDRHPRLALDATDDLLRETGTAAISIVSQEAKYQLLAQLRVGARLTVVYHNEHQQKVEAQIILRGLNQALEFIDEFQAQTRIASDLSTSPSPPHSTPVPVTVPTPVPESEPLAQPKIAPRKHWASELAGLMPAIEGCLEWVPGADQLIDKAWVNGGNVTVRSRHRLSGARVACVLPVDGSGLDQIDSIPADAAYLPGEGGPIFTPGTHNRAEDECLDHEVVTGTNGKPLGWLSFRRC